MSWRTSIPKRKADQLKLMAEVPPEHAPDWQPKNSAKRLQWLSEARVSYWTSRHQKPKRSFTGITAKECNEMLRKLGPPPLYGEGGTGPVGDVD